jgi:hypothetical protein
MSRGSKLAITLLHPYIPAPHSPFSPYLPKCAWTEKKRGGEKRERANEEKGNRKKYQGPEGPTLPFFLSHGFAGLDSFHRYVGPSAKTREVGVYVGGGA